MAETEDQIEPAAGVVAAVPFKEALRYWTKLGFINFGGPAGQISIMHQHLVDDRRWISEHRFLHALSYCMLLPGPEAQQLAIYVGWLLHGTAGGIAAGVLFVLPAFFLMLALSWLYAVHGDIEWVAAVFYGLRAAVVAIVAHAVIRIGSKALRNQPMIVIAGVAFVSIFVFDIPFPFIVLGAALVGLLGSRRWPHVFASMGHGAAEEEENARPADRAAVSRPSAAHTLKVLVVGLAVWLGPLVVVGLIRGRGDVLTEEAIFFGEAAMVTFGGAYAVLSYINQAAVERFGWLGADQMVTGLGLAESTPGPLILVTQFVGFLGAYKFHGDLDPVVAGILGSLVTVWATFAPCFLWIFLGAPYIERLRGNRALSGALAAITAAVVGVILNLALWFSIHTLFDEVEEREVLTGSLPVPRWDSVDLIAAAIAIVSFIGLVRYKWKVIPVVAGCALVGLLYKTLI